MGKRNRLSRDQKRRSKLAKQSRRSQSDTVLAYRGNKYRTEELVPLHLKFESGIYESFVISDRQLTDQDVESALCELILQVRQGFCLSLEDDQEDDYEYDEAEKVDLLIWRIREQWELFLEGHPLPRRDDLIGVLRSILGSIEAHKLPGAKSQGYLHYIEGFLNKMGVYVASSQPAPL